MKKNRVKEMMKRGELTLGTWVTIGNPDVAEILGNLDFDWLVFDTEHGPLSMETVQTLIQATTATQITPIVRVAWNDLVLVKRALDIGAYGVVIPWVNNKEDALKAAKSTKYPPAGLRGVGPRRCSLYGLDIKDYMQKADSEIFTMIQIETGEAVKNVDEILTVDGIDAFFVGPTDLSTSLGVSGRFNEPVFVNALQKILDAGKKYGIHGGTMTYTDEQIKLAIQRGFKFISLDRDFRHLIYGAKALLAAAGRA